MPASALIPAVPMGLGGGQWLFPAVETAGYFQLSLTGHINNGAVFTAEHKGGKPWTVSRCARCESVRSFRLRRPVCPLSLPLIGKCS